MFSIVIESQLAKSGNIFVRYFAWIHAYVQKIVFTVRWMLFVCVFSKDLECFE